MPGGDRTGPIGMGPMTGWGAGFCRGLRRPGFFGRRFAGRFPGYGRGIVPYGFFQGPMVDPYAPVDEAEERRFLKARLKVLKDEVRFIEERLEDQPDKED